MTFAEKLLKLSKEGASPGDLQTIGKGIYYLGASCLVATRCIARQLTVNPFPLQRRALASTLLTTSSTRRRAAPSPASRRPSASLTSRRLSASRLKFIPVSNHHVHNWIESSRALS